MPCLLVSLEGVLGAGKTTALKHLTACGIATVDEPLDDFGFLLPSAAEGKLDPAAFQISVLCSRFACQFQACTARPQPPLTVTERSMGADRHVFAATTLPPGPSMDAYLLAWQRLADTMTAHMQVQTIYVYLKCDADTAIARVRARGRAGEGNVSREYLQQLIKAHDSWLSRQPLVHVVDATQAPSIVAARVADLVLGLSRNA